MSECNEVGPTPMQVAARNIALMETKLKVQHEEQQKKDCARRFAELVTRVLQAIHFDRDGYGPLSVYEPDEQLAFKAEIQEVCKRYL